MIMKKIFLIPLLLVFINQVQGQKNWKLIYENDADGNAIFGELNDLISAFQRAESIRIYFKMGKGATFVEHTALVKFSTITNSPHGRFVTAQIDPIIGQIPDYEKGQVRLKENLEWALIASTTGQNDQMTRNTITGEIVDHTVRQWGTKWYVQE